MMKGMKEHITAEELIFKLLSIFCKVENVEKEGNRMAREFDRNVLKN
jgi:hypothetical protein